MTYLVLVRHGESIWNTKNVFTGWTDVPLTEKGFKEAQKAAKELKDLSLDVAFTSKLERAQGTLLVILAEQKKTGIFLHENEKKAKWFMHPLKFMEESEIPIYSSSDLNERYYGALQGKNKDEMRKKYGEEQVFAWRRSYDVRPPKGESLKDVYKRVVPYFEKNILPQIKRQKNVLVSAHGNSLRAMIKYLDNISDEDIPHLELPFGKPIVYKYSNGKLRKHKVKHSFTRKVLWD
jgi:2,3-bisphosphoglycerate-dependent phosphoglycerate mutase